MEHECRPGLRCCRRRRDLGAGVRDPDPAGGRLVRAISRDSRWIITQEWLAEGFAMWGIAAFVIAATAAGSGDIRLWVYRVAAALLVAVGVLTAVTGARTPSVWFKVCLVVMAVSASLLLSASLV